MRSFYIQENLIELYQMKISSIPDASPQQILSFQRYGKQIIDDQKNEELLAQCLSEALQKYNDNKIESKAQPFSMGDAPKME